MPKPKKYREVVKILRAHDPRFEEHKSRGKGSERAFYHPDIGGKPKSITVKCHGKGTELRKGTLAAIIRRFNLPSTIFD